MGSMAATALMGGVSIIGGALSANAAGSAAQVQADAANRSADMAAQQNALTRADLAPYNQVGTAAAGTLQSQLGYLSSPTDLTQAGLEASPGYQFNLSQGLQAAQNSASARGLGVSGAAMKGASAYATGLADSTYQNQFAMDQTNKQNSYNRLFGVASLGENAAAQTGISGTANTGLATNALTGGANATAAGIVGSANAINGGFSGASSNAMSYLLFNKLLGANGTGQPASAPIIPA